jgi:hypothetical protein
LKLKTVTQVADDWLNVFDARLENPQFPRRVYNKDNQPYSHWQTCSNLAVNFYRFRNAGQLALRDISNKRPQQYHFLARLR